MITIGKSAQCGNIRLDVNRLIESRLLVTASSGAGKSWLLRKILEEISATTQTIVIDPEGEFASLREIRDMLLVGESGELPADPRSAGLLARRLMELRISAVIDIYELTPPRRREWVANFCTGLVNLPKELWHPCVIAIDELHEYAPSDKTKDNVANEPVALLNSKGRKRGYAMIGATQRLAKLNLDVAAELKNRFLGQAVLDVDQKRAADYLGFAKNRFTELRDLHAGEFFAVGPALEQVGVVKFRADLVKTTHPKAGEGRSLEPPQPSRKIMVALEGLKDLPQQAAAEAKSLAEALNQIRELKSAQPGLSSHERQELLNGIASLERIVSQRDHTIRLLLERQSRAIETLGDAGLLADVPGGRSGHSIPYIARFEVEKNDRTKAESRAVTTRTEFTDYGPCGKAILEVLSQFPDGCTLKKVLLIAGYRLSGSFKSTLSRLREDGLVTGGNKDILRITEDGKRLGPFERLPGDLASYWLSHSSLGKCARVILKEFVDHPRGMMINELLERTNYSLSGSTKSAISDLRTAGLIEGNNTELMKASAVLLNGR